MRIGKASGHQTAAPPELRSTVLFRLPNSVSAARSCRLSTRTGKGGVHQAAMI